MRETVRVCSLQLDPRGSVSMSTRLMHVRQLLAAVTADVIILPELWPTDFFAFDRYRREAEKLDDSIISTLADIACERNAWIVGGSFVEQSSSGRLHNCAVVVNASGAVVATYRKTHLFGIGSRERELVSAGDALVCLDLPWGRLGLSLCYDLRFPELYRELVNDGAEIVAVSAAWPRSRVEHWEILLRARAIENQVFVLGCCASGTDSGVALAGATMTVSPWGEVLAHASDQEQLLYSELDIQVLRELRESFPVLQDRTDFARTATR